MSTNLPKAAESLIHNKFSTIAECRAFLKNYGEVLDEATEFKMKAHLFSLKKTYRSKVVRPQPLLKGQLSLGPKPGTGKLEELKKSGTEVLVTLLKQSEKVEYISAFADKSGVEWIWFPLFASELEESQDFGVKLLEVYDVILGKLELGKRVHIHCAAGVHRTGLFSYGLILRAGLNEEEAKEKIYQMRPVTAIERVERHWNWSAGIVGGNQ